MLYGPIDAGSKGAEPWEIKYGSCREEKEQRTDYVVADERATLQRHDAEREPVELQLSIFINPPAAGFEVLLCKR